MDLDLLPNVLPELMESVEWYEIERADLGVDLLLEIDRALDRVAEGPLRFPAVFEDVRRAQVDRFPFGVFFVLRSSKIAVFAIMHFSRSPAIWKRRIPK